MTTTIDVLCVESAFLRILTAPRPPADQEYFHQVPSLEALYGIRSPLDLALLATLHWRATRRPVALFSTARPFMGFGRRAVQGALVRLQAGGFITRLGIYAFQVHKGPGQPLRASFLGVAREGADPAVALALRLVLALAAGILPGQRAIKKALCVSDQMATLLLGMVRKHKVLLLGLETAPQGAVFILRSRRAAPNRAFLPPEYCPESCAINDLTEREDQSNYRKDAPMPEIDSFKLKITKILPESEVVAVKAALDGIWKTRPEGYSASQLLYHGFDIWLSRGGAAIDNLGGYLSRALGRRKPQDPTPALDRALADSAAKEAARAAEGDTMKRRAVAEDMVAKEAEALFKEIELVYPDFRTWGIYKQSQLIMSLGENPQASLARISQTQSGQHPKT